MVERGRYVRNRKSLFTIVLVTMMSVAMIAAMGIANVSAQPVPEIVIRPDLVTGTTDPGVPPYGYATYYVNIKNAPHLDYDGDPAYWDVEKTWAWQVDVNWDPSVLGDPLIMEDTYTLPGGKTTAFLGYFTYWTFTPVPVPHWVENPYPRSGLTTNPAPWNGKVVIFDGLKSTPDVTTVTVGAGDPNPGLHLGSNYDLPYSEGIDISSSNPTYYGPNELNLFILAFPILQDGPPAWSRIWVNLENTYFWCHDATTVYSVSPMDAWFGVKQVPEFPFGIEMLMILAPLIPIICVWRRKR